LRDRHGRYDDFLQRKPCARIGYSIYIYHITRGSAEPARPVGPASTDLVPGDDAT